MRRLLACALILALHALPVISFTFSACDTAFTGCAATWRSHRCLGDRVLINGNVSILHSQIRSMVVNPGCELTVFQHEDYAGARSIHAPGMYPLVSEVERRSTGKRDHYSSAKCECHTANTTTNPATVLNSTAFSCKETKITSCAAVFDAVNCTGRELIIGEGYSPRLEHHDFDEAIRSLVVNSGCALTLYQHVEYGGSWGRYVNISVAFVPYLNKSDTHEDRFSSYVCKCFHPRNETAIAPKQKDVDVEEPETTIQQIRNEYYDHFNKTMQKCTSKQENLATCAEVHYSLDCTTAPTVIPDDGSLYFLKRAPYIPRVYIVKKDCILYMCSQEQCSTFDDPITAANPERRIMWGTCECSDPELEKQDSEESALYPGIYVSPPAAVIMVIGLLGLFIGGNAAWCWYAGVVKQARPAANRDAIANYNFEMEEREGYNALENKEDDEDRLLGL